MGIVVVSSPKAEQTAAKVRSIFYGKPARKAEQLPIGWPSSVKRLGRTNAVLYFSDKMLNGGYPEIYKHIAESAGDVFVNDRITTILNTGGEPIQFVSTNNPFEYRRFMQNRRYRRNTGAGLDYVLTTDYRIDGAMPKEVSVLAENRGLQVYLPTGTYLEIRLPRTVWASAVHPQTKETFLLCYGDEGIHFIITGDDLGITKDGIVG